MFDQITELLRKLKPEFSEYEDTSEYLAAFTTWGRVVVSLARLLSAYSGAPSEQEFKKACDYTL